MAIDWAIIKFGFKRSGVGVGDLDYSISLSAIYELSDEDLAFLKRLLIRANDQMTIEEHERFLKRLEGE